MAEERTSLDTRVYQHLLGQISARQVELGSFLKAGKLAVEMNVSRTTVRKALSRLIDDGWVKQTPAGHTYVAKWPPKAAAAAVEVIEVEQQSQIKSVYWLIFDWILQGNCQFGAEVNPRTFVDLFGASMGTVRHALDALTRDGILIKAPRRGWRYGTLTWQDIIDTIEIRTMFESEVLRRAGHQIPQASLEELKAETENVLQSIDTLSERDRRQADYHFHTTLVEQTTSLVLIGLVKPLIRRSMYCSLTSPSDRRHQAKSFREHLGIIDALQKGDVASAVDVFQAHMSRSLLDGLRTKLPHLNSNEGIDLARNELASMLTPAAEPQP
ncbi:GntR family transcriptional regulator [Schlesneria sp. T3-172]|uniref:GntR family transcriptional regulator n=1 Tax=Schlesneria sphaerica TaxID=3373610 RepID=UPI0037C8137C